MKKAIILAGMLLNMFHTAFAEQRGVFMEFHHKIVSGHTRDVNRAPMRIPVEVVYDSNTRKIEVIGNESLEAEVFLYNVNGSLEGYSSILNSNFTILTPGNYTILIKGDGWYAEGEIEA